MPLDNVAQGDPHVPAHNDEREAINTLETLVTDGRLSDVNLRLLIQELIDGGAAPAMRFADLEDVSLGEIMDSSVARYDSVESVWTASPGYDIDAQNFRGDWQNPGDTLLWSSDFTNQGGVDVFSYGANSAGVFVSPSKTSVLSPSSGESLPAFDRCAYLTALGSASSATLSTGSFTFDPTTIPALTGKYLSKMSYWRRARLGPGATGNNNTKITAKLGATVLETPLSRDATAGNTEVISPWSEKTYSIGDTNVPFSIQFEDNGSGNASVPYQFYIAGLRFYGAADTEDLYNLGDVVAYDGSYWRSLFDNNTHEPTDLGGHWYRIPPAV